MVSFLEVCDYLLNFNTILCVVSCRLQIHQDVREEVASAKSLDDFKQANKHIKQISQVASRKLHNIVMFYKLLVKDHPSPGLHI